MGSIGIISLTNSAKSKIDLLPNIFQLLRCGPIARASFPTALAGGSSSDPLVGELLVGDHGSGGRW
jgi:hypothetical protein